MNKLLSANFARLWRDKVLWLGAAAMAVISAIAMLDGCRQAVADGASGFAYTLDHYFFNLVPLIGLFGAVFTSLFLGTEYSDGAIRNKLVVGHTRLSVYLASLAACFAASLVFLAAWFLGSLAGIPTLGTWAIGPKGLAIYLLLAVLFSAALSAIFTLVGMCCSNKPASAVACILVFLALLVFASMLYNRLGEPEMNSGVVITSQGMQMMDPAPNPDYIGGSLRKVYEFVVDFLPTGQVIQMANQEVVHPLRMGICSILITAGTTLAGVLVFRKKDLK